MKQASVVPVVDQSSSAFPNECETDNVVFDFLSFGMKSTNDCQVGVNVVNAGVEVLCDHGRKGRPSHAVPFWAEKGISVSTKLSN